MLASSSSSQHACSREVLILGVSSKMSPFSLVGIIFCTAAVSSFCPNNAFSIVKESKETCTTLHGVGLMHFIEGKTVEVETMLVALLDSTCPGKGGNELVSC